MSRAVRTLAALPLLAALAAGCQDRLFAPVAKLPAALQVSYAVAGVAGGASTAFDRADAIHVRVATSSAALVDTTVAFDPAPGDTHVRLGVNLQDSPADVAVDVELRSGGKAIFTGTATATLTQGQTTPVTVPLTPVPAAILVAPLATFTALGDSIQATAAVLFATGDTVTGLTPTWSSLDPQVATVSAAGIVVATGEGTGRLQATWGGLVQTVPVAVQATVASIALSPQDTAVLVGSPPLQLRATAMDRRGHALQRTLTFSSASPNVATVDAAGLVTPVGAGVDTLTAAFGTVAAFARLTVQAQPPAITSLSPDTVVAGSSAFTLRVRGTGFSPASVVRWNGAALPTTFVGATELDAAVDSAHVASAGAVAVTVSTPPPGGGVSAAATFTIRPPVGLGLSPTAVTFTGQAGGTSAAPQVVNIANTGGGTLSGLQAAVGYAAGQPTGWLAASLGSTTAPTTLTLQANPVNLAAGTYGATVTVSSSLPGVSPATVAVTFRVAAGTPTVTISAITDTTGQPVNVNNLSGTIRVAGTVRLPPGVTADSLQVGVDTTVACTTPLTGASGTQSFSCTINTAAVSATGAPVYPDGTHTLFARLLSAGTVTATATQTVVINNAGATPQAPVISGLSLISYTVNDSINCPVDSTRSVPGTAYRFGFSYTDANGDVALPLAPYTVDWVYSPSGSTGSASSLASTSGTGGSGSATANVCVVFNADTTIALTFKLADSTGLYSNPLGITVAKPVGANSAPIGVTAASAPGSPVSTSLSGTAEPSAVVPRKPQE